MREIRTLICWATVSKVGTGNSSGSGSGSNNNSYTPTTVSSANKTISLSGTKISTLSSSDALAGKRTADSIPESKAILNDEYKKKISGGGSSAISYANLHSYANGTRDSKGKIIITGEEGPEAILPKLSNGQYALVGEGSQVFTKEQTDKLYELANAVNTGSNLIPIERLSYEAMKDMFSKARVPEPVIDKRMSAPVYIDNRLTVNGDVNDLKNLENQMQKIADRSAIKATDKGIDKFVNRMYDGIKYGR